MGQEILYCFKCQTRLLGSDFERGKAFRVDSQAACPDCVRELLAHLPNPDAELEKLKRAHVPKPPTAKSSSTKIPAVRMDSTARIPLPPAPSAGSDPAGSPSRTPLIIAGVVGALVVVALLAVSLSRSTEPRPAHVVASEPRPDPPPRPVPQPNPASPIARDLEELDARIALPMRQEKFQEVAALLAAARAKHGASEWTEGVDERLRKLQFAARRLAAPILEQAGPAVKKNDQAALKSLRSRIEAIGVPGLTSDFDAAVAAAASDPWIVLDLQSLASESGATLSKLADGSVLAGGKPAPTDIYTMSAKVGLRQVRAFRLEAVANPELPSGGPGRAKNGNFVLSEFKVQSGETPIAFSGASATFEQDRWPSSAAIDGNPATGWAIA